MLEKHFEDVLSRYPDLIESGLKFIDRQINVGGKFADLLFEDRFGQKLIIELKKGVIKREHMAQLLDYEGHFLSPENPNVRVMLIGNRVPPNISKSLDHHGFEWKEITEETLKQHLQKVNDSELLSFFDDIEEKLQSSLITTSKEAKQSSKKGSRSGLPQLNQALDFNELVEIINIRSTQVPSCYMDMLLLENQSKTISEILKQDWWPYAEKINDNHFPDKGTVNKHIKYRQERGWEYEFKGDRSDPIVRLIGLRK
jgi:hypothetical protein